MYRTRGCARFLACHRRCRRRCRRRCLAEFPHKLCKVPAPKATNTHAQGVARLWDRLDAWLCCTVAISTVHSPPTVRLLTAAAAALGGFAPGRPRSAPSSRLRAARERRSLYRQSIANPRAPRTAGRDADPPAGPTTRVGPHDDSACLLGGPEHQALLEFPPGPPPKRPAVRVSWDCFGHPALTEARV
jgi:hypothetical protein